MPEISADPIDMPCDVLVVGGGPAGSTAAALLAERGWRVVLVEKDQHPRFHIGESLLPLNLALLERLGVMAEIEKIGMPKYGAEFVSPDHDENRHLRFRQRLEQGVHPRLPGAPVEPSTTSCCATPAPRARRSSSDAGRRGRFPEGGRRWWPKGATASGRRYRWRARFLVDATGRDTLLAGQLGLKRRNRKHNSAAIFGHFTGAKRLPGKAQGNISICWFDHGWFWFIPLADGTTSVGAVCWPGYMKRAAPI